jgi:hypothetical protein
MAKSFLSPVPFAAPEPMPWNWNPAQTFMQAYYDQQASQRAQQKFVLEQEIERELFPLKVQTAQMQLEKLLQDRDRTMLLNEQIRESRRNASAGINAAISGGSNASANNQTPSRRAAVDWNAWGNPSAQQTSDDLIP